MYGLKPVPFRRFLPWNLKGTAFRACVRTMIYEFSPGGTAELSPGRSPGYNMRHDPVPQGRLKVVQDWIAAHFQPSLRDWVDLANPTQD
jgi:hypothetical protein